MKIPSKPTSTESLGLLKGTATLSKYTEKWKARFTEEESRIKQAFSDFSIVIYHIGSTSVPGLDSKPVIDLAITLSDPIDREVINATFKALGYNPHKPRKDGEYPWFEYGQNSSCFQAYIFDANSAELNRHVSFCRILTKNSSLRKAYLSLKREASSNFGHDPKRYAQHKKQFIEDALYKSPGSAELNSARI